MQTAVRLLAAVLLLAGSASSGNDATAPAEIAISEVLGDPPRTRPYR